MKIMYIFTASLNTFYDMTSMYQDFDTLLCKKHIFVFSLIIRHYDDACAIFAFFLSLSCLIIFKINICEKM